MVGRSKCGRGGGGRGRSSGYTDVGCNFGAMSLLNQRRRTVDASLKSGESNSHRRPTQESGQSSPLQTPIESQSSRIQTGNPSLDVENGGIKYFGSEEFKAISERNKKNRETQVTRHLCGTRSFAEVEESTRSAETGEKAPPDRVWELQHTHKNDKGEIIWSDPHAQQVHVQLQELVAQQQSDEAEHQMSRDEILTSVLGERPGYVRGKGYGKKPPKKSRTQLANVEASVSSAMDIVRQEMQTEMDKKLQEERAKMEEELQKKLDEEHQHVTVEVDKKIQEQMDKLLQEKLAAFMTQM